MPVFAVLSAGRSAAVMRRHIFHRPFFNCDCGEAMVDARPRTTWNAKPGSAIAGLTLMDWLFGAGL